MNIDIKLRGPIKLNMDYLDNRNMDYLDMNYLYITHPDIVKMNYLDITHPDIVKMNYLDTKMDMDYFFDSNITSVDIKSNIDITVETNRPQTLESILDNDMLSPEQKYEKIVRITTNGNDSIYTFLLNSTRSILTSKAFATTVLISSCALVTYAAAVGTPIGMVSSGALAISKYFFNKSTALDAGIFLGDVLSKSSIEKYLKDKTIGSTNPIISENMRERLKSLNLDENIYKYTYDMLFKKILASSASNLKLGIDMSIDPYSAMLKLMIPKAIFAVPKLVTKTIDLTTNVANKISTGFDGNVINTIKVMSNASTMVESKVMKIKDSIHVVQDILQIVDSIDNKINNTTASSSVNSRAITAKGRDNMIRDSSLESKSITQSLQSHKLAILATSTAVSMAGLLMASLSGQVTTESLTDNCIPEIKSTLQALVGVPISLLEYKILRKSLFGMMTKYIGIEKIVSRYGKFLTTDQLKNIQVLQKDVTLDKDSFLQKFFDTLLGNKIYSDSDLDKMDVKQLQEIAGTFKKHSELKKLIRQRQLEKQKITYHTILECVNENMLSASAKIASIELMSLGYSTYKDTILNTAGSLNNSSVINKVSELLKQSKYKLSDEEHAALLIAAKNPMFSTTYLVPGLGFLDSKHVDPVTATALNALNKINGFLVETTPIMKTETELKDISLEKIRENVIKTKIDDILLTKSAEYTKMLDNVAKKMDKIMENSKLQKVDGITKEYKILSGIKLNIEGLISKIDDTDVPSSATTIDKQKILDGLVDIQNKIVLQFGEYEKSLDFLKSHLERFIPLDNLKDISISSPKLIVQTLEPLISISKLSTPLTVKGCTITARIRKISRLQVYACLEPTRKYRYQYCGYIIYSRYRIY